MVDQSTDFIVMVVDGSPFNGKTTIYFRIGQNSLNEFPTVVRNPTLVEAGNNIPPLLIYPISRYSG